MKTGSFRDEVANVISRLPADKVTTYGDIAVMIGRPHASRMVGGAAHYGDGGLPWHRLVNRFGGLASGYPGGKRAQAEMLLLDGIRCTNGIVDNFKEIRWNPDVKTLR